MLSIYKDDPYASFGFIGVNGLGEPSTYCTKRYRVYSLIMATYFSDEYFLHKENKEKSAYIMINRKEMQSNPNLVTDIENFFYSLFTYFD